MTIESLRSVLLQSISFMTIESLRSVLLQSIVHDNRKSAQRVSAIYRS